MTTPRGPRRPGPGDLSQDISGLVEGGSGVFDGSQDLDPAAPPAPRGPRWEWLGDLGAGGMGRVALVRDHLLGRDVALKEPTSEADASRLNREAAITAALEHPGVVPVYDLGAGADGTPWFAMRVVNGRSLASLLAANPPARVRMGWLRYVLAAAETVAFAHDRGYLHCDLKPANIMIGTYGETQVIDWGLGIELAAPPVARSDYRIFGTPRSMSPEQARGEAVGKTTDVWALGLVLWEIVAGHAAFNQEDRAEILAAVRKGIVPSLAEAAPDAPAELVAIVTRATAKSPADRYPDAKALADDLERYLAGRRVSAFGYSNFALLARLVRAWRLPLSIIGVALLGIAIVVMVSTSRLHDEEQRARGNLALAMTTHAQRALSAEERGEAEVLAANALAAADLPAARGVLAALSSPRPARTLLPGPACAPEDIAGERSLCRSSNEVQVYEGARLLWSRSVPDTRAAVFFEEGAAVAVVAETGLMRLDSLTGLPLGAEVVFGTDSNLVRTGGRRGAVVRWHEGFRWYRAHSTLNVDKLCQPNALVAVALDATEERFAAFCGGGQVTLGALEGGSRTTFQTELAPPTRSVITLAFIPGSDDLLVGTVRGLLARITPNVEGYRQVWSASGAIREVLVAPDGRRAVVTWDGASPLVLDLASVASLGRLPDRGPFALMWASPTTLVAAGADRVRWDYAAVIPRAIDFQEGIAAVAVSSDGERVAVAHGANVAVLETRTRKTLNRARWQAGLVKDLAFLPGTHDVAAYGFETEAVARIDERGAVSTPWPTVNRMRRVAGLADGAVIGASYAPGYHLWEAEGAGHTFGDASVNDLIASPDGHHLAALSRGDLLRATDLQRGGALTVCGHEAAARAVAPFPDGRALAVLLPDTVIVRCGAGDDVTYRTTRGADLASVAASAAWIAAGGRDGKVWLWRVGQGAPVAIFHDHEMRVDALAFDPAGAWLVAADWSGHVAFFDTPRADEGRDAASEAAWGLTAEMALGRGGIAPDP